MTADDAKAKAEKESPLIKEAHAMLVKWEAGDPEVRALWRKMNEWCMPDLTRPTRLWCKL